MVFNGLLLVFLLKQAWKIRKPGTLSLKTCGLGDLWVHKVFQIQKFFWVKKLFRVKIVFRVKKVFWVREGVQKKMTFLVVFYY